MVVEVATSVSTMRVLVVIGQASQAMDPSWVAKVATLFSPAHSQYDARGVAPPPQAMIVQPRWVRVVTGVGFMEFRDNAELEELLGVIVAMELLLLLEIEDDVVDVVAEPDSVLSLLHTGMLS